MKTDRLPGRSGSPRDGETVVLVGRLSRAVPSCRTALESRPTASIGAFEGHLGPQPLQVVLFDDRSDHAEADEVDLGQPEDALRPLRVALEPGLVGAAAGGAAALGGLVGP